MVHIQRALLILTLAAMMATTAAAELLLIDLDRFNQAAAETWWAPPVELHEVEQSGAVGAFDSDLVAQAIYRAHAAQHSTVDQSFDRVHLNGTFQVAVARDEPGVQQGMGSASSYLKLTVQPTEAYRLEMDLRVDAALGGYLTHALVRETIDGTSDMIYLWFGEDQVETIEMIAGATYEVFLTADCYFSGGLATDQFATMTFDVSIVPAGAVATQPTSFSAVKALFAR